MTAFRKALIDEICRAFGVPVASAQLPTVDIEIEIVTDERQRAQLAQEPPVGPWRIGVHA